MNPKHITLSFMYGATAVILAVDVGFKLFGLPTISETIRDYSLDHYWPVLLFVFLGLHFFWRKNGIITPQMNKGAASLWPTIAMGASSLLGAIAMAFASTSSSAVSVLQATVAEHSVEISQLKTSECIQNANMRNLAAALKTSFVSDPACSN